MIDPEYRALFCDTLILLEAVPDDVHCSVRVRDAKERIRQRMAPLPAATVRPEAESLLYVPKVGDQVTHQRSGNTGTIIAIPSKRVPDGLANCDVRFDDGREAECWLSMLSPTPSEPAGNTGQAQHGYCSTCQRNMRLNPALGSCRCPDR